MAIKSIFRFAGLCLTPACICVMLQTGCASSSDEERPPVPPGAYVAPTEKPASAGEADEFVVAASPAEKKAAKADAVPSLEEIAQKEDTPAITAPVTAGKTTIPAAAPTWGEKDTIYTIQKNDTLSGIAARYGIKAASLADYNGITLKTKIYPGKTLHIPAGVTPVAVTKKTVPAGATVYVVKSGDTLGGIAHRHGVRMSELAAINNLDTKKPIYVGQKLAIPASAKKTASAAPAATKKTAAAKKSSAAKKTTAAKQPAKNNAPAAPAAEPVATADASSSAPAAAADTGAAAADNSSAAAPAAKDDAVDPESIINVNLEREMNLEEAAKAYDRSFPAVKKLNPSISPDTRLKAGTEIKIPMF